MMSLRLSLHSLFPPISVIKYIQISFAIEIPRHTAFKGEQVITYRIEGKMT